MYFTEHLLFAGHLLGPLLFSAPKSPSSEPVQRKERGGVRAGRGRWAVCLSPSPKGRRGCCSQRVCVGVGGGRAWKWRWRVPGQGKA